MESSLDPSFRWDDSNFREGFLRKGFTLIELLVVIAIMGLLMSISTAAIFSARNKRQAKSVAQEIQNIIMETHAYIISPKTTSSTVNPLNINIYQHQIWPRNYIGVKTLSSRVNLVCYNSAGTAKAAGLCLSFIINDTNKMGQLNDATKGSYIIASSVNAPTDKYKITVGQLSGNVTITKL